MFERNAPARGLEVSDFYGRRYRVGISDRELLGHSRRWMFWLSLAPMLAAGTLQYGYGAVVPTLVRAHGWNLGAAFWVLAAFTVFQAGVGFPAARLREHRRLEPRAAAVAGGVLSAAGLVLLGHTGSLAVALVGYALLGGTGVGLVYATCVATVARWYPERSAASVGFVGGAFAFGAVPFAVLASTVLNVGNHTAFLDAAGLAVLLVVAGAGVLLRDPPPRWWPTDTDPRVWALDKRLNRGLRWNRPAVRRFRPTEVVHNGTFATMYGLLALAAAVGTFDLAYLAVLASGNGLSSGAVAASFGLLLGVNGVGRAVVSWLSDRAGRNRVLAGVLLVGGVAQFGLLGGGTHGLAGVVLVAAGLAGLGCGCCYPLLAALVRDYFGDEAALENFGIVYSAKAVGAVAGIGLAALVVTAQGDALALALAAGLGLAAAALARLLHQPGRPATLLPGTPARVTARRNSHVGL
jgi:MFS family permease